MRGNLWSGLKNDVGDSELSTKIIRDLNALYYVHRALVCAGQ
jgi:hypothetical protein